MQKIFVFLMVAVFSTSAFAYGGGGSSRKSCKQPKVSKQTPPKSSVVAPGSEISFSLSRDTNLNSIEVSVKGEKVDVDIAQEKFKLAVTGRLPESIKDGYAKIVIKAKSKSKCAMKGGWLLKIAEQ